MKGIILHGGSGTRLRPLTYTDVKQLLPLAGKPVSEYALTNLIELGILEINIVLGKVGYDEVRGYYGDGKKWGVNITYTLQGEPLGIAHAIGITREFVGDEDFVVVLGDNYFQNGFLQLLEDFKKDKKDAFVALIEVSNPQQFGVAEISNGKIVGLVEKPKAPKSNYAVTGVYFLKNSIFLFIDSLKPSWRGELEITEAFQKMIDSGMNIGYSVIKGWWKDTGTVEEFLDCNRMVLENPNSIYSEASVQNIKGRVSLGENVTIDENSHILGPCYIGPNTKIENSYIGPYTSIGSSCQIKDSEIENSVIMDSCKISLGSGNRIRESLLGASVTVESVSDKQNSIKLILGRDSKVIF